VAVAGRTRPSCGPPRMKTPLAILDAAVVLSAGCGWGGLHGIHRSTYYRWQAMSERFGLEILRPRERRPPQMPGGMGGCVDTCSATASRSFSERRPYGRTRSSLRDRLDDLGGQIPAKGRLCAREQPQLDLPLRIAVVGRPCGVHDFNDAAICSDRPVHGR